MGNRGMPHPTSPRLLLVEDDTDTASLMAETLEDHFGSGCVHTCASVADAKAIDPNDYDMVLTDMYLPDGSGLELLNYFLKQKPHMPIVLVTADGVLESAMMAIRRGAYDYIVKAGDYLFAIPLIVEKNLAIWRTKQENRRLEVELTKTLEEVRVKNQQLEEAVLKLKTMAATDPLTGLSNRRSFGQALVRRFAEAQRYATDLACVMIDVDHFKLVNDALGHQAGDDLLQIVAGILEVQSRRSDIAGRFGGDEFVLLLPKTNIEIAKQVGSRISEEFAVKVRSRFSQWAEIDRISLSMGVATLCHSHPDNPDQLVVCADVALYRAKQAGKGRLAIYGDLPQTVPDGSSHRV